MKIACISAANIEPARGSSASVRACETVRDLVGELDSQAVVEIIPLIDYEMQPCRMCGGCVETQRCARDEAFNRVFDGLIGADAVFVVVPHYAPLPSKLMMLTEKMEEMAFLGWCADSQRYSFPLHGRLVGVVGHGGQELTPEVTAYYQRALVEPVAGAFRSVSMQVVGAGEEGKDGVVFGIRSIRRCSGSVFVDIEHDWQDVRARITPLVWNVVTAAKKKAV